MFSSPFLCPTNLQSVQDACEVDGGEFSIQDWELFKFDSPPMPPESLTDTKSVSQFLRGSVERHFLGANRHWSWSSPKPNPWEYAALILLCRPPESKKHLILASSVGVSQTSSMRGHLKRIMQFGPARWRVLDICTPLIGLIALIAIPSRFNVSTPSYMNTYLLTHLF